jgi:hypothetical protein
MEVHVQVAVDVREAKAGAGECVELRRDLTGPMAKRRRITNTPASAPKGVTQPGSGATA